MIDFILVGSEICELISMLEIFLLIHNLEFFTKKIMYNYGSGVVDDFLENNIPKVLNI